MPYDRFKHHRQSTRLAGYDYTSARMYFLTMCLFERKCLFGNITDGVMVLNEFGLITQEEWLRSFTIRQELNLDEYCIMPNHIHGVVMIQPHSTDINVGTTGAMRSNDDVRATGRSPLPGDFPCGPKPKSIGAFMAGFRSAVTKRINLVRDTPGSPIWQRNYYDHIVRDHDELLRIRQYIRGNPQNWDIDEFSPVFL